MVNQKNLELIAVNGSIYRFELLSDERKVVSGYKCKKIKAGETYELENAVYLAMGLDEELEERTVNLWGENTVHASIDAGEIGLALSGEDLKPTEKNSANAKRIIELINDYDAASRVFLTIVFNKGLVLPKSRVVYFNRYNQKLVHSGLIKNAKVKS